MACILWSIFNQRIQATLLGVVIAIFPRTSLLHFSESRGYPGIRFLCLQWKLGLNSSKSTPAPYAEGQISLRHLICHNLSLRRSCKALISSFKLWRGQGRRLKQQFWCQHSFCMQTWGSALGTEGTATLPWSTTQQAASPRIHTDLSHPSYMVFGSYFLLKPVYFSGTERECRSGKGDLTLPVFAVSASVSFQEFFSASGFCSSVVLLWCCDFPVSLLYVEELLSCLFEDIYLSVLAWYRPGAYFINRLQQSTAPSQWLTCLWW